MASTTYTTLKTINATIQESWAASLRAYDPSSRLYYQKRYETMCLARDIIRTESIASRMSTLAACQGTSGPRPLAWNHAISRLQDAFYTFNHNMREDLALVR